LPAETPNSQLSPISLSNRYTVFNEKISDFKSMHGKNDHEIQILKQETESTNKKHLNRKDHKKKRLAIILGDSMTKDIKQSEMGKKLKNTKVLNNSFSRATTEKMMYYIQPSKNEEANIYLLHFGTNNLRTDASSKEIADNIVNIALELKNESNEVCVSEICRRGDKHDRKAVEVNEELEKICGKNDLILCKNDNIKSCSHLNRSKLHLNTDGSRLLQNNFLNILNY